MFSKSYADVFQGDERWRGLVVPKGETYAWEEDSTYIRQAPYFDDMSVKPAPVQDIKKARVLAVLGDSVTTDHISPAGSIKKDSPAGKYLQEHGVKPGDFNSYGSRRGNHEVMVRGTFANVRLRNKLVATEGGFTRHLPTNTEMSIFDASEKYRAAGTPLVILAGKEYGSGSSRDWAAKGPALLGVRAVIAESYERIHRSNLVGMGVLPLQFPAGQNAESLKLTGEEVFEITGIRDLVDHFAAGREVKVRATSKGQTDVEFSAAGPHRHAAGSAVLRQRRDLAVCAAAVAGDEEGASGRVVSRSRESPHLKANVASNRMGFSSRAYSRELTPCGCPSV